MDRGVIRYEYTSFCPFALGDRQIISFRFQARDFDAEQGTKKEDSHPRAAEALAEEQAMRVMSNMNERFHQEVDGCLVDIQVREPRLAGVVGSDKRSALNRKVII